MSKKLIHFSLVLREREERKTKYFAPKAGFFFISDFTPYVQMNRSMCINVCPQRFRVNLSFCADRDALLKRLRQTPSKTFVSWKGLESRYRQRFFVQVGHETTYASSEDKHFFTKQCHRQTYQNYEQPPRISQSRVLVLKIGQIFPKKMI